MPRKSASSLSTILYSVHPAIAYTQAIIANLPEKTGRSLEEWLLFVRKSGQEGEKAIQDWLKKEHQLGGTTAAMIAHCAGDNGSEDYEPAAYLKAAPGYVEGMYAGAKSALRPIHDALVRLGLALGADVKICPCKTIVPLYRRHVFAEIKPATRVRIDFGLALKGTTRKLPPRLIDTGGLKKGNRITHRIPISSVAEIDAEVKEWARVAYDLDAED